MSDSRKEFKIGGETKELFYSQAVQLRLIGTNLDDQLSEYLMSPDFYVRTLQLLLLGKEHRNDTMDEVLDLIEDMGLTDDEGSEIVSWVTDKILNFIQKKMKNLQAQMKQIMPQLIESNNTLNGLEEELTKKPSI